MTDLSLVRSCRIDKIDAINCAYNSNKDEASDGFLLVLCPSKVHGKMYFVVIAQMGKLELSSSRVETFKTRRFSMS